MSAFMSKKDREIDRDREEERKRSEFMGWLKGDEVMGWLKGHEVMGRLREGIDALKLFRLTLCCLGSSADI